MKGIRYFKHLTSAAKLFVCSKKSLYFVTSYIPNRENLKFEIDAAFGILQLLIPRRLLSVQHHEYKQVQDVLQSVGFTKEEIEINLKNDSGLFQYPVQKLNHVTTVLIQHGMAMNDIKQILLSIPHIVEVDINDLNKTINKWRELRLDEEKMFRIFTKSPLLLLLASEYIDSRLKEVLNLFTNADITVLVETMPSIFISDWNSIIRKIHYIQSYMGFTQIQMMRTNVLEHSLMHIKTRHMFITLSGIFKTRDPKKQLLNNPSLKSIVDSTDEDFVKKCGLTLEEYYVFSDIMAKKEMEDNID